MDFVRHMFFEAPDSSVIVLPRPDAEDRRVLFSSDGLHFRFCEPDRPEDQGGIPQFNRTTYVGLVIGIYEPVNNARGRITYNVGINWVWFRGREYQKIDPSKLRIHVHEYDGPELLRITKPTPRRIGPEL